MEISAALWALRLGKDFMLLTVDDLLDSELCGCVTGNSKKGIVLYRNADVLLRASELERCEHCLIVVCKVSLLISHR